MHAFYYDSLFAVTKQILCNIFIVFAVTAYELRLYVLRLHNVFFKTTRYIFFI